jgi:hypothetical protein
MENFQYKNNYSSNYFVTKNLNQTKLLKNARATKALRNRYLRVMHPDILASKRAQFTLMLGIVITISVIGVAILLHDFQSIRSLNL